ncbi:hypothetical protein GmHk_18G051554 [Glycine max]|nr:hypothetical protein GmHk_18G051554 [Glycine max]
MGPILSEPQRPLMGGCAEKDTGHPEAKHCPQVLSHEGYEYLEEKLMAKKTKKKLEEAAQSEITKDSLEEQASQDSFVPHGRQDVLTAAIGRPEHPGRVRAIGVGVTIKQYFGLAPQTSRISSSMAPEELEQLTQQIRD